MTERGITRRQIDKFALGYSGDTGPDHRATAYRLTIPYLSPAGPWQIKYRCLDQHEGSCKDNRHGKYTYDDGATQHLFNAQTLLKADRAVLVEGEIDAISVEAAGANCVSYPGAQTWASRECRHFKWCFDSLEELTVVGDGDPPEKNPANKDKTPDDPDYVNVGVGEQAARMVADSLRKVLPDLDVHTAIMPLGHDSNSYIQEHGQVEFLEQIGWI